MKSRFTVLGMTLLMLLVSLLSGAAADVITSLPADSIYVQDLLHYAQAGLTFENGDTIPWKGSSTGILYTITITSSVFATAATMYGPIRIRRSVCRSC